MDAYQLPSSGPRSTTAVAPPLLKDDWSLVAEVVVVVVAVEGRQQVLMNGA